MDNFITLPIEEQTVYFKEASARLSPQVMQKDFWVCWTMRRLFSLHEVGEALTFKGGTSLSKVYGLINRFSEDIDLSIERGILGFGGDNDPESAGSNKATQRRIKALQEACKAFVGETILPRLRSEIGRMVDAEWSCVLDEQDTDQQTILFKFPNTMESSTSKYLQPVVKIELGARSDHWPTELKTITPYLAEAFPDVIDDSLVSVKCLKAERTFWEKATILHYMFHMPTDKATPIRMSRHYYDLFQMLNSPVKGRAMSDLKLLDRVAHHKSVFFKTGWARYHEAKPGTMRLVPSEARLKDLEADFRRMEEMFFDKPASFESIIEKIAFFESEFNSKER